MNVEIKNWRIFFVHTVSNIWFCPIPVHYPPLPPTTPPLSPSSTQPNRTYYLEDPTGQAQEWVDIINQWLQKTKSKPTSS